MARLVILIAVVVGCHGGLAAPQLEQPQVAISAGDLVVTGYEITGRQGIFRVDGAGPSLLAEPPVVSAMTVAEGSVYWINGGGSVGIVPVSGGQVVDRELVVSPDALIAFGFAVGVSGIYYTRNNTLTQDQVLMRAALDGSSPGIFVDHIGVFATTTDADAVYFAACTSVLTRVDLVTRAITQFPFSTPTHGCVNKLVADHGVVVGTTIDVGTVFAIDTTTSSATLLYAGPPVAESLAMSGGDAFFVLGNAVARVPVTGGGLTTVASADSDYTITSVAADATQVVYAEYHETTVADPNSAFGTRIDTLDTQIVALPR